MHLLPLSLGVLADIADRPGATRRFLTDSVFLRVNSDNTFEAVATDTKVLVQVSGPCVAVASSFPEIPEFAAKPDAATIALIPAVFWKRAFTWAKRVTAKVGQDKPALRSIAVRISESETSFATASDDYQWFESVPNTTGRFPPCERVLADCKKPRDRLEIDPWLLAPLLRVAAETACDPKTAEVILETYGPTKPVVFRAGRGKGLQFVGALMPLTPEVAPIPQTTDEERIATLERSVAELQTERDALAKQVAELKAALADARTPTIPGME
jgi:hypothetical protein